MEKKIKTGDKVKISAYRDEKFEVYEVFVPFEYWDTFKEMLKAIGKLKGKKVSFRERGGINKITQS